MSAVSAENLTIPKFADLAQCDEKQVRRAIKAGKLKPDADGKLSPDLVNSGWRRPIRSSKTSADTVQVSAASVRSVHAPKSVRTYLADGDDTPAQAAANLIAALGAEHDLPEAIRIKENFNALLKQLEYEEKSGTLVELSLAEAVLFEEARASRDAWMNWPARIGPSLAADLGLEADHVTEALTAYVHKQIADLGEPAAIFEKRQT